MLRITGGEFRGRFIKTPKSDHTRPTQARLRQALFNSIQMRVADAQVLDLFAGSGALGFEALSRGAQNVVFVESARAPLQLLSANSKELDVADRVKIVAEAVPEGASGVSRFWESLIEQGPYDIVLADPPYADGWEMILLEKAPWERLLTSSGIFCLEWGTKKSEVSELPEKFPFLVKAREKNYGDSVLTTYERASDVPEA